MNLHVTTMDTEIVLFATDVDHDGNKWIVTVTVTRVGEPRVVGGLASYLHEHGDWTFRYGRDPQAQGPIEKVFEHWRQEHHADAT